jgi:hypothetical protein
MCRGGEGSQEWYCSPLGGTVIRAREDSWWTSIVKGSRLKRSRRSFVGKLAAYDRTSFRPLHRIQMQAPRRITDESAALLRWICHLTLPISADGLVLHLRSSQCGSNHWSAGGRSTPAAAVAAAAAPPSLYRCHSSEPRMLEQCKTC